MLDIAGGAIYQTMPAVGQFWCDVWGRWCRWTILLVESWDTSARGSWGTNSTDRTFWGCGAWEHLSDNINLEHTIIVVGQLLCNKLVLVMPQTYTWDAVTAMCGGCCVAQKMLCLWCGNVVTEMCSWWFLPLCGEVWDNLICGGTNSHVANLSIKKQSISPYGSFSKFVQNLSGYNGFFCFD